MNKLIMMKGLPASGKSTKSRKIVGNGKTCIRVNRDDLRIMLYGPNSQWGGKKEDIVIKAEKSIAANGLNSGIDVVIDDTNLSPKNEIMWREFAGVCGSKFEILEMSTHVDECVLRDVDRHPGRVGRAIIENMALRYGLLPELIRPGKITIWDVDGTLIDISDRLALKDKNGKSMHPSANRHMSYLDRINKPIASWALEAMKTTNVFIVSGRGTDEAITTQDMLELTGGICIDRMFMRNSGDPRPDTIVKQEILDRIISRYGKDSIEFVVDDRPEVVEMWRNNDIKVFPVNQAGWERK